MSGDPIYLRRLKIKNFRSFGEFELDLHEGAGLTVVHGANGLGKSSLFDAVEWGLTGDVERIKKAKGSAADKRKSLMRYGASAPPRVEVEFTDLGRIVRELDQEIDDPLKLMRYGQPDRDVLTNYLHFTHFLGQSAQHRFILKEGKERLACLTGPARLEDIREVGEKLRRLSGPALKSAKAAARQELEMAELQLQLFHDLKTRRETYRALAHAEKALEPVQVIAGCQAILDVLDEQFSRQGGRGQFADADEALSTCGAALMERHSAWENWHGNLELAAQTLAEYERANLMLAELDGIRADGLSAREQCTEEIRLAEEALAGFNRRRDEKAAIVNGVKLRLGNLRDLAEKLARLAQAEKDIADWQVRAAGLAEQAKTAKDFFKVAEERVHQLVQKENEWTAAIERRNALLGLHERIVQYLASAKNAEERDAVWSSRAAELEIHRGTVQHLTIWCRDAEVKLRSAEKELEEARARAGAIQRAVALIAAQLDEDAECCPVCNTAHHPPALKRLAEEQALAASKELPEIEDRVARLLNALTDATSTRTKAEAACKELEELRAAAQGARAKADHLAQELTKERELAGHDPASFAEVILPAIAHAKEQCRKTDEELKQMGDVEALRAELAVRKIDVQRIEAQQLGLGYEQASLQSTRSSLEKDVDASAHLLELAPGWQVELPDLITRNSSQLASLEADMAPCDMDLEKTRVLLADLRSRLSGIDGRLGELDTQIVAVHLELQRLLQGWKGAGLGETIDGTVRMAKMTEVQQGLAVLKDLTLRQARLVAGRKAWTGLSQLRGTEDELTQMQAQHGAANEAALEERLTRSQVEAKRKVAQFDDFEKRAKDAYDQVLIQGQTIQKKALEPMNKVLDAFSNALLPDPHQAFIHCTFGFGETASVNMRKFGEKASPELYLSEGQMAALNVAVLLSASVTYPWSRWPALLMDDPLHHNDVIHASAFMDVVCNLIKEKDYQIILSTHDGSEAEYFMRKAVSAGIPTRSCRLLNLTSSGVDYEANTSWPPTS